MDRAKHILRMPNIYRLFTGLIGASRARSILVGKHIRPEEGDKILDVACGAGDMLEYLPDIDYYGFDINQKCIDAATSRFGNRGKFSCKKISRNAVQDTSAFDIVLAGAIIHHLDDEEASQLFELSKSALKEEGRLITYDGCYIKGQSPFTQFLFSMDRGGFVRTKEEYEKLASQMFSNVKVDIRNDLLRIPYTHIIMECVK